MFKWTKKNIQRRNMLLQEAARLNPNLTYAEFVKSLN